jgi:hypothetical protein
MLSLIFTIIKKDNGDIIILNRHIMKEKEIERVNTSAYSLQNPHPSCYFRDDWFLCKYK